MKTQVLVLAAIISMALVHTSAIQPLDTPQVFFDRGMTLLRQGEFIKAISQFTNAINIDKTYAEAYYQRAVAKQRLSKAKHFEMPDLIVDLILAYKNGHQKALGMLESEGHRKCLGLEQALILSDQSFCLDLSSQNLKALPSRYAELILLVYVKLYNNKFDTFPEGILGNEYLLSLDISSNFLGNLPDGISKLSWLVELNLSKNEITSLPNGFTQLAQLKRANLSKNQLQTLPMEVGKLQHLEELDLSFNQLKSLPASFKQLTQLKRLILIGNPIDKTEIKELRKILKNTEIFAE